MTIQDFLKDIHAKQYIGLDDDMPDDYGEWVDNLTAKELDMYLQQFINQKGNYGQPNS